jgi:cellulose synthase/poly-beta-1,6-N-acetylglucosamine synthase-like glycosyltransferase
VVDAVPAAHGRRRVSPLTAGLLALLVPMAVIAVINLVAAPRLHRLAPAPGGPLVSVLVPARDEETNLRRLLPALAASGYPDLEVVILDDGSRDGTAAIARSRANEDPRFRLVDGLEPPPGWTGKNWACHQLSHHARGELLIFCDADVVPGPHAVGRTVTALSRDGADVVTAFPDHDRGGWFEEAVVPLVAKLPVAGLLVLPLVRRTKTAALAVGNGQWFAWRRDAYLAVGRHAAVRNDVLEDVRLARLAKRSGLELAPFIATRDLGVRMYRAPRQVWEGFVKNVYALAGGKDRTAGPIIALFALAMAGPLVLPLVPGAGPLAWAPLVLLGGIRLSASALFRDGIRTVVLHPVAVPAVLALAVTSRLRHRSGRVSWKGRYLRTEGWG